LKICQIFHSEKMQKYFKPVIDEAQYREQVAAVALQLKQNPPPVPDPPASPRKVGRPPKKREVAEIVSRLIECCGCRIPRTPIQQTLTRYLHSLVQFTVHQ